MRVLEPSFIYHCNTIEASMFISCCIFMNLGPLSASLMVCACASNASNLGSGLWVRLFGDQNYEKYILLLVFM